MLTYLHLGTNQKESEQLPGYVATYRLLCGKGFGIFSIWETTLMAQFSKPNIQKDDDILDFSDNWVIITQVNSSSPILKFGCFLTSSFSEANHQLNLWRSLSDQNLENSQDTSMYGENILSSFDDPGENSNISSNYQTKRFLSVDTSSIQPSSQYEVLFQPAGKDFRTVVISRYTEDKLNPAIIQNKSKIVRGCGKFTSFSNIRAASQDGSVLFGGDDYLIICKYIPSIHNSDKDYNDNIYTHELMGSVAAYETFSLQSLCNTTENSKKSRHLRVIESITCTPDGSYAIIVCSDNTCLLYRLEPLFTYFDEQYIYIIFESIYSLCDIFGVGINPTESHCSNQFDLSDRIRKAENPNVAEVNNLCESKDFTDSYNSNSGGYLTTLFQAIDKVTIEVKVDYAIPQTSGCEFNCSCSKVGNTKTRTHLRPDRVVICFSWWLTSCPSASGVIKISRLAELSPLQSSSSYWLCKRIVPQIVINPHVGICSRVEFVEVTKKLNRCICGDSVECHWNSKEEPWRVNTELLHVHPNILNDVCLSPEQPLSNDYHVNTHLTIFQSEGTLSNEKENGNEESKNDQVQERGIKRQKSSNAEVRSMHNFDSCNSDENNDNIDEKNILNYKKKSSSSSYNVLLNQRIKELEDILTEKEVLLKEARSEAERIMRKADQRFNIERKFRISVNVTFCFL
jgi:hypothetical protein